MIMVFLGGFVDLAVVTPPCSISVGCHDKCGIILASSNRMWGGTPCPVCGETWNRTDVTNNPSTVRTVWFK